MVDNENNENNEIKEMKKIIQKINLKLDDFKKFYDYLIENNFNENEIIELKEINTHLLNNYTKSVITVYKNSIRDYFIKLNDSDNFVNKEIYDNFELNTYLKPLEDEINHSDLKEKLILLKRENPNSNKENTVSKEISPQQIQSNTDEPANDNLPNEFYKKCEELELIIPFDNIKKFVDNYIIKQALLLWYIALKYTDKYMNYINEHDKKLMLIFYDNFRNKYAINSQKIQEIYKSLA